MCVPTGYMTVALEGELLGSNMCLKFIDTDQEKKIDVGVSWPYEKLEPGECLIAAGDWPYQTIEIGDKVEIEINWTAYFINMWSQFEPDNIPLYNDAIGLFA